MKKGLSPAAGKWPQFHFRSVFISDVHLGSPACQSELVLELLAATRTRNLYLVGDIVDTIRLKRSVYWPQAHSNVVRSVLGKAKHGTRVVYIPGNHDAPFRDLCGMSFGNLHIRRNCVHEAADGRRYLVLHGDEFDAVVKCSRLAGVFGRMGYRALVRANTAFNRLRARLGYPYWSLAAAVKQQSRAAQQYVRRFREAAVAQARRAGVDGVICGHIHVPDAIDTGGVSYLNDGDWVEHCTVLVEHLDGRMELIDWPKLLASTDQWRRAQLSRAA